MNKYFSECRTAEELKKAYREAAKRLHPDAGGDAEEFKRMQAEFSAAWDRLKNIHENKDGEAYEKETTETAAEFMNLIERLLRLDGVAVEICGSWVWCTGDTYKHREALKELHFCFSKKKSAWYFHREPYRKHGKKELTLDEIRNMYGSRRYGVGKGAEELEAATA